MMTPDSHILQSVGWALVHSLWQSAALYVLYLLVSRLLGNNAALRYALATSTLVILLVSFLVTLGIIYQLPVAEEVTPAVISLSVAALSDTANKIVHSSQQVSSWIDQNLLWVIRAWLVGSLIGMLRILSGISYLYFLRRNAQPVASAWEEKINHMASGLQIGRRILIAEARVASPMVIGYLKPMVLFPVGLIASLSSAQVEAILIHELAHIRRHDFVVNLFQCVMESLFFFNPIVWLLSSRIRVLREHCCDDIVIRRGIEPLIYVKTLALVEEVGAGRTLAMALAGEQNQLLNRMKRIMERSVVRKEWGRMRLLPLLFALVGLACASWLSIRTEDSEQSDDLSFAKQPKVAVDTVIDKHAEEGDDKIWHFYRFDSDDNGTHAYIEELPNPDVFKGLAHPPMPPLDALGWMESDSIPGFIYAPSGEWATFEKEFTEKFRTEFQDFFEKNEGQFEKMMEELRRQHEEHGMLSRQWPSQFSEDQQREFERLLGNMPNFENMPGMPALAGADVMRDQELRMADMERMMSDVMREQSGLLHEQAELLKIDEMLLRENEEALHKYEKEMVDQLIRDGYLEKGESVSDLRIHNDEITVNGKKVKEKDVKKYKNIRDKYEPRWIHPHRPE